MQCLRQSDCSSDCDDTAYALEDYAYSLLGVFDVHMPLLYGEGWKNAAYRPRY